MANRDAKSGPWSDLIRVGGKGFGFRVEGLGFTVLGFGFRVQGFGFRGSESECKVHGSGF